MADMTESTHLFTPAEAAARLRIGDLGRKNPAQTLIRLHRAGKINAIKIAGRLAFRESDLKEYINAQDKQTRILVGRANGRRQARGPQLRSPSQGDAGAGGNSVGAMAGRNNNAVKLRLSDIE
jgi:hypothetical protein